MQVVGAHNVAEHVGYLCSQGRLREAIAVVRHCETRPDYLSLVSLVQACGNARSLPAAKQVHSLLRPVIHSFSHECNVIIHNHVIRMYDKCRSLANALQVFESMPSRNRVSWNLMLAAYARAANGKDAFRLLLDMQHHNLRPDKFTFVSVMSACAKDACSHEGMIAHFLLACHGLDNVQDIGNALISFYGMLGQIDDALRTLRMMPKRDVSAWNSIFTVCSQLGQCEMAFQLYAQMRQEGVEPNKVSFITLLSACRTLTKLEEGKQLHSLIKNSGIVIDVVLGTAIVDMYSKCGDFDSALKVFTGMPAGSSVSWSVIISAHVKHGYVEEARALYRQMHQHGMKGNTNTFLALLETCSTAGNLVDGKVLHSCIVDDLDVPDDAIQNALINMYNRCGSLVDALAVFKGTAIYDSVSWNAMISANSQHGNSERALELFLQMQMKGIGPTANTFISVFSACSHTGLLNEGILYFSYMCHDCGLIPLAQHYTCMIDLLARAGQLEGAEMFAFEMPMKPGILDWMSLVSACRAHGDMDRATDAANQTIELDPLVTGAYIALTNIFAVVGKWDCESLHGT